MWRGRSSFHRLFIAELHAYPGMTETLLLQLLDRTSIETHFQLKTQVWREAGLRYARYAERRRGGRGGESRRLLADFAVGAHALLNSDRLLTFDTTIFRTNFPDLLLCSIDS